MNLIEKYKQWKAERLIRQQQIKCSRGYHNWTDKPGGRIQCTNPGCGRYLQ